MVNVILPVIINCRGLKKTGLHLGLVELNGVVIKKNIIIIFWIIMCQIVLRICDHFFEL